MISINMDQIKNDPSSFLKQVENGESLIILHEGKPLAELKPIHQKLRGLRPYGLCKGEFVVPDDFDAPLPEQLLNEFEGI